MASLDFTAPKLGSGARFRKLSGTLAARGAHNPDALAAWIGAKKYGRAGMGKLSHGKSLANPDLGIYLAETTKDDQGETLTCPECGHVAPAGDFGASGASLQTQPGDLRTPAPSTGSVRDRRGDDREGRQRRPRPRQRHPRRPWNWPRGR